jgi:hypothetical protein
MSASELAPFVAAVFEGSAVAGLLQENNKLKSKLTDLKSKLTDRDNERLLVEVMGQHGTPVYSEESFKNAERHFDDAPYADDDISLNFRADSDDRTRWHAKGDGFPLSSLNEIGIRLGGNGGVVVQRFNIDDLTIHFQYDPLDDDNYQMESITLKHIHPRRNVSGPITCVRGTYGPLPLGWRQGQAVGDNPFLADLGWGQELTVEIAGRELAGRTMLLTDFFRLVADENNGLTPQTLMTIHELVFDEQDITGIMSLINE